MIKFKFTRKRMSGNNPPKPYYYRGDWENKTPAEAMLRLVHAEFACGAELIKVSDTVITLGCIGTTESWETSVFQGPTDEMEKLVALAKLSPKALEVYKKSDEFEKFLTSKVQAAAELAGERIPPELAVLVPVESKGWQVLQRSLLQVFGATKEEMDLGIECELSHEDMCLVCEMVEEDVCPSFAEAFAWVKEESAAA